MNNYIQFFSGLAVMEGVTYLVRMLPLVLVKKKIENRFIAGFVVALILAYFERGLLTVAAASCAAVFIAELIMKFIH